MSKDAKYTEVTLDDGDRRIEVKYLSRAPFNPRLDADVFELARKITFERFCYCPESNVTIKKDGTWEYDNRR